MMVVAVVAMSVIMSVVVVVVVAVGVGVVVVPRLGVGRVPIVVIVGGAVMTVRMVVHVHSQVSPSPALSAIGPTVTVRAQA